ncbi:MAG: transcriptional repressor [Gammaproteobacteria bacterium]|nr:transcriptional repressor [Gammaproteobacteria bacterium]MDH5693606.1 transcriptional repressor [Gammaproteobacteria bacterium]
MNEEKVMHRLPKSEAIAKLREHQIAPTQQRVEIAQILLAAHQHMSAEQLLEQVNVERNKVSKATVYNTLGLFARKGLVKEVIIDPTKVYYDSNVDQHHHFYNMDTGELIDIDASSVELGQLPTAPSGTKAENYEVIIRLRQSA